MPHVWGKYWPIVWIVQESTKVCPLIQPLCFSVVNFPEVPPTIPRGLLQGMLFLRALVLLGNHHFSVSSSTCCFVGSWWLSDGLMNRVQIISVIPGFAFFFSGPVLIRFYSSINPLMNRLDLLTNNLLQPHWCSMMSPVLKCYKHLYTCLNHVETISQVAMFEH